MFKLGLKSSSAGACHERGYSWLTRSDNPKLLVWCPRKLYDSKTLTSWEANSS